MPPSRARAKAALLGLPLLILSISTGHIVDANNLRSSAAVDDSAAPSASANSSSTSMVKKFLSWPLEALSREADDDVRATAYPLWSTRRDLHDEVDEKNVLFSFTLSGRSVERYQRRQAANRRLQGTDGTMFVMDTSAALEAGEEYFSDAVVVEDVEDGNAQSMSENSLTDGVEEYNATTKARVLAGDAHEMVVHVTYEDIYAIVMFMIIATGAGMFTAKLGMPALVGEIFAGFLLGPPLANFVPYPEALVLVGEIGLIMLLLEAGVELDVAQLRETGARALAIGLTGTCLPLLVGTGLGLASGSANSIKSALAVGASFSPTSLGVAASALKAGKMLDTPVGQLIVAACVVDDVMALILLSLFKVLVKDNPPIIQYFIPIISSVGFLIVLGGSAVTWMPRMIEEKILSKCSEAYRNTVMFSIMVVILLAYLPLLNYTQASYLMGAFLCGCIFSQIEHAHHTFMHETHQLMVWLLRVFFAASIGFQVPIKQFGDPYVIGWGFILYLCVAAKLPLAFYVPQFEDVKKGTSYNPFLRDRLITALAMTCRGEMSFIIAAFALGEGMFTAQMYAAIVWAVLLSCITSPFMLLNLIKYFNKLQLEYLSSTNPIKLAKETGGKTPLFLHIKVKAPASGGMQEQFRKIVNELDLEVVERRTNRNGRGLNATVQTDLYVRDATMSVQLQKIAAQKKIKKALQSAMESQAGSSASAMGKSFSMRQGSFRPSSSDLSNMSLNSLEKEEQDAIQAAAKEEDAIIKRGDSVERKIEEALGEGADVVVDVWNPWPWTEVLDKICEHYGVSADASSNEGIDVFLAVFDKIDADGGGSLDQEEMYDALVAAGVDITEEGVLTLFAMIDEDGNGDVDRDEWRETVEFYLELKEEEREMENQQADHLDFMKRLRAKKLEQLGQGPADVTKPLMQTVKEDSGSADGDGVGDTSDDIVGMDIDA